MVPSYEELPEEIWELVLNRLEEDHHSHFEFLSLVSKRFLSLTDRLRLRFNVVDQTYFIHGTISRLVYRFKHLKTLDLSKLNHDNLETALHEIARSSVALNLEVLDVSHHDSVPIKFLKELGLSNRKLKGLKCSNLAQLRDGDLLAIAKFQPDLEELDISYPRHKFTTSAFRNSNLSELTVTDVGIEVLSSCLKNLIKINISRNQLLTDKSVLDLSSNCLQLQEITFIHCSLITMKAVRFVLHNSPNLRTISMCRFPNPDIASSHFIDPATSAKGLCSLHFKDSNVSNEFLNTIAEASVPLKRFSLSSCVGYTIDGISSFLHVYRSLEFLDITKDHSLSDYSITCMSQNLHDLVSIKLNFCRNLTSTTLFTLINNCPFLEDIEFKYTNLGKLEGTTMDLVKKSNSRVKSLNLAGNLYLTNECLVKITSVCPNIKLLDLKYCSSVGTEAMGEILRGCSEIRHLSIRDCGKIRNLGLNLEPLKLEKLYIGRSGVNDEGLLGIADRCNRLEKIDMAGCVNVTTAAVKGLVRKCEKLREIGLNGCPNVDFFIVDWMVFTRPSLRKLIPPSYAVTTKSQRQLFLRHGCEIYQE